MVHKTVIREETLSPRCFKEMCHLLQINKMWSTAYHAEGNGQMGANDEIPSEVVNVPGKSEYRLYLADMVPVGELEQCGERDQEIDISDMEGSGLADVQNGETNKQERTEDKHEAEEQPTTVQYS